MRPRISIRGSVRPSRVFFLNEPMIGENGLKGLGKQSECSKLVKKLSELSQNVHFRRIVVRMDLFM